MPLAPHHRVTDEAGARPSLLADSLPSKAPWHALAVHCNAEFVVSESLAAREIEHYLPTYYQVSRWSDREKTIIRPLFPGYLFVRVPDRDTLNQLLMVAGVVRLLPSWNDPAPISDAEIANVCVMLASMKEPMIYPYVEGDEVVVESGPLAGVRGIVVRVKTALGTQARLVVRVELLKRAVSVEIDADTVTRKAAA